MIRFSHWLLKGISGSKPGFRKIFSAWLFLHVTVGIVMSALIETPIRELAKSILLPLIGIIIGLSFAWAGNAQGFIQTQELIEISKRKKGGYIDYVFTYQLSILTIMVSLGLWFLASLDYKSFETPCYNIGFKYASHAEKIALKSVLFTSLSLSVHEAWSTIKGVHYFLLMKNIFSEHKDKNRTIN